MPSSVRRALNYNEQKVKTKMAQCVFANGFFKEGHELNFYEKLHRFERLNALNKRAKSNTLHISLNFSDKEQLAQEKLIAISQDYMRGIGFDRQPYLVYQHFDAGHPHVHIVTTTIQKDGKRIPVHNLGKNLSARVRRELEQQFSLIPANSSGLEKQNEVSPVMPGKIAYGKSATKRAITSVLDHVLSHYRFSSLAELNAVLGLYRINADGGKEGSRIHQRGGLVYRVLDTEGKKIGMPVKASSIYNKPTLRYLVEKFLKNEELKTAHKKESIARIRWVLMKGNKTVKAFSGALEKEGIHLVVRSNDEGVIYGLTYIDHKSKCVFNGSALGKEFSAKAILDKLGTSVVPEGTEPVQKEMVKKRTVLQESVPQISKDGVSVIGEIITPTQEFLPVPFPFKKQKKKRKKLN
jgi:hypothetical protein